MKKVAAGAKRHYPCICDGPQPRSTLEIILVKISKFTLHRGLAPNLGQELFSEQPYWAHTEISLELEHERTTSFEKRMCFSSFPPFARKRWFGSVFFVGRWMSVFLKVLIGKARAPFAIGVLDVLISPAESK